VSALADTPPADILDRIASAYERLNAIEVVATRDDAVVSFGQNSVAGIAYFYAEKVGNKYRVQMESDGTVKIWPMTLPECSPEPLRKAGSEPLEFAHQFLDRQEFDDGPA
jgi:hypothetical protein